MCKIYIMMLVPTPTFQRSGFLEHVNIWKKDAILSEENANWHYMQMQGKCWKQHIPAITYKLPPAVVSHFTINYNMFSISLLYPVWNKIET